MTPIELPKEKPSLRETLRVLPSALYFIYSLDRTFASLLVIVLLVNVPIAAASVVTIKRLTDALAAQNASEVWLWMGLLVSVSFVVMISEALRGTAGDILRYKVQIGITKRWLEHMNQLPYHVLEDTRFQSLAQAFDRKSHMLANIGQSVMWASANFFECLGLLAVLFYLPWQAVLIFLGAQVLRVILMKRAQQWSWDVIDRESREGKRAYYYQYVLTRLAMLQEAKAYGFAKTLLKRWSGLATTLLEARVRLVRANTVATFSGDAVQFIGLFIGLFLVLQRVLAGELAISVVVVFMTTLLQFQRTIASLAGQITWFNSEAVFLPIFDAFFRIVPEADTGKALPRTSLTIAFEDVWFRYPDTDQDIIRGLNFQFHQGDHIALVGLNGAGKSTLLKLLMRMYEPTRGRILVNGIDLRTIKPSAWRSALSILTQNIQWYDDTMENQILYGDIDRPKNNARLRMATHTSNIDEVIQGLPKGLQSHLGKQYAMEEDRPTELSGGQNQMLAIARTLYRDARIYIFDEPTSAVDAEKEEHFFSSLPEALQSRALIFVSHRFSTLRRARRILVMDAGCIIEDGTHEELLAKKGRYAELFTLQAKLYQ
jgi:ATP-binding cassette subfamily B protein